MSKIFAALLLASATLALSACDGYVHKMPPTSASGGIGSPTGPATGPASMAAKE
jgi:hypothetical protein